MRIAKVTTNLFQSVIFGHFFRSLFEHTEHSINPLITKSFGSDKEHTIATDIAAPARNRHVSVHMSCTLNALSDGLEDSASEVVAIVRKSAGNARVAETPEALRKSDERGSGRRRREKRRVSEGRYGDFERSDEGGVKGLS